MLDSQVLAFTLVAAALTLSPGADTMLVLRNVIKMGIIWLVSLSIFLDRTRRFIIKTSVRRWLDGFCGAILVGLGLRLVFEDR